MKIYSWLSYFCITPLINYFVHFMKFVLYNYTPIIWLNGKKPDGAWLRAESLKWAASSHLTRLGDMCSNWEGSYVPFIDIEIVLLNLSSSCDSLIFSANRTLILR